jgi:hypothetical protein
MAIAFSTDLGGKRMIIAFPLYLTKIGLGVDCVHATCRAMQHAGQCTSNKSAITLIRPYAELYAIPNLQTHKKSLRIQQHAICIQLQHPASAFTAAIINATCSFMLFLTK